MRQCWVTDGIPSIPSCHSQLYIHSIVVACSHSKADVAAERSRATQRWSGLDLLSL